MFTSFFLKMLNREASSPGNMPEKIVESLQVQPGYVVADIGSGGGYFTLKFAGKVGETGKVYAVDTKPQYLDFIRRRAEQEGLNNIYFLVAKGSETGLPEASLDLVFARNVFHHLPEPVEFFRNLKRALKPDGRVAIIDHAPGGGFGFVRLFKHHTPVEVILQEMKRAGYLLVKSFDFLPGQTFNLFKKGDVVD
ncbi:MAG: class I SAM-dependent methyltransferase [Deltaproteobacteria bacterium]|nr:class I SAM-dependent methyltransferase [Deltaproteobacteria bacterium]